jgi:tRNA(fMet)-specific endonuclease VapC
MGIVGSDLRERADDFRITRRVHRANTEQRRQRRSQFVDSVVAKVAVLDFTLACARVHAEIVADLASKGQPIGAHDLIIAATARHHDLTMLTENVNEFARVPGLQVLQYVRSPPHLEP